MPIRFFIALFGIISCTDLHSKEKVDGAVHVIAPIKDTLPKGKIISNVVCTSDTIQSYALYIPVTYGKQRPPVVFFFDPHAAGALPLNKYKILADKYGFILVGSNNSKNGNDFSIAQNIWNTLSADVISRISIDTTRMYACGFSGGAKVAGYIALSDSRIKGVIANSAALPDGVTPGNFGFSFTGIAGTGDMNMTNVISFVNALDKTTTHHRLLLFNGKHEWAAQATMNMAFAGLQLDAMRSKQIAVNNEFISDLVIKEKRTIEDDISDNKLLEADATCKLLISLLDGVSDETAFFKTKDLLILSNPLYQQQATSQHLLFTQEENIKSRYNEAFQNGDVNYWTTTIQELNKKAAASTDEGAMNKRLLAYLSLAFYSISNQMINANKNAEAQYFVSLYKMADPTNSDAWYFSAIVNARNGNSKATEDDLIKAAEYGFADKQRMRQQAEFRSLSLDFDAIEKKMHADQ
ncbi:hypothetical protein [Ferruginibacter albus]|uniref:hypothetical protein n=1 Tax=Ferruginibacter albus TaxID=2875540 RepID=UPI001CC7006C|nr:hypothetical protein [Ferruginibacter albus]UAY51748.1 hypothetical protein K9M53_14270 [Ferruginibacter albus]